MQHGRDLRTLRWGKEVRHRGWYTTQFSFRCGIPNSQTHKSSKENDGYQGTWGAAVRWMWSLRGARWGARWELPETYCTTWCLQWTIRTVPPETDEEGKKHGPQFYLCLGIRLYLVKCKNMCEKEKHQIRDMTPGRERVSLVEECTSCFNNHITL